MGNRRGLERLARIVADSQDQPIRLAARPIATDRNVPPRSFPITSTAAAGSHFVRMATSALWNIVGYLRGGRRIDLLQHTSHLDAIQDWHFDIETQNVRLEPNHGVDWPVRRRVRNRRPRPRTLYSILQRQPRISADHHRPARLAVWTRCQWPLLASDRSVELPGIAASATAVRCPFSRSMVPWDNLYAG